MPVFVVGKPQPSESLFAQQDVHVAFMNSQRGLACCMESRQNANLATMMDRLISCGTPQIKITCALLIV